MTTELQSRFEECCSRDHLNELGDAIVEWRESKNFVTPNWLRHNTQDNRDAMLGKLMLVVTELAEAAEAVRHMDSENFQEEIADAFIRLLDIARSNEIDIDREIAAKMARNCDRPNLHGKSTSL